MKLRSPRALRRRGSVLIIVLWVAFGLVALALYFAHAMSLELRAADNRTAGLEAAQAIEGAARYVSNVLATAREPATLPDVGEYRPENVTVAEATFWLIGRGDRLITADQPYFGLVDEAGKLNLNAPWLTADLLQALPRMTPELAAAIIDWRDTDSDVNESGGAETETYQRRNPAYRCKNGPFESVEELRMINGAYLDLLFGEDANLNGLLDANENDGDASVPADNRDGRLDSGLLEYFTVSSLEPVLDSYGSNRVNVTSLRGGGATNLLDVLNNAGVSDPTQVVARVLTPPVRSVLEFYARSGLSAEEFGRIETRLTGTNTGLINVNTASEAVLACVPGLGAAAASTLVAFRISNPDKLNSVAWVRDVLETTNVVTAGPYLTGHSWQFTADIAAVGHHGRGYRRVKFLFDASEGTPRIRSRQELTHLGWALGQRTRQLLLAANENKR